MDTLTLWKERISDSQKWRTEKYEDKWKKLLNYYRGKYWEGSSSEDRVAVNYVYGIISIIMPAIYYRNPYAYVEPLKPEDEADARIYEDYINYLFDHIDFSKQAKLACLDALVVGHGWIKTGYVPNLKPYKYFNQSTQIEEQGEIDTGFPYAIRISPFDIFISPKTRGAEPPEWIAHRVFRTDDELQKNTKYNWQPAPEDLTRIPSEYEREQKKNGYEIFEI